MSSSKGKVSPREGMDQKQGQAEKLEYLLSLWKPRQANSRTVVKLAREKIPEVIGKYFEEGQSEKAIALLGRIKRIYSTRRLPESEYQALRKSILEAATSEINQEAALVGIPGVLQGIKTDEDLAEEIKSLNSAIHARKEHALEKQAEQSQVQPPRQSAWERVKNWRPWKLSKPD